MEAWFFLHRVLETSGPGNDRDRNGNGKKVALMASLARSPHRATTTTTTRMSSLAATMRRRKCERMESTTQRRASAWQNHATQHEVRDDQGESEKET